MLIRRFFSPPNLIALSLSLLVLMLIHGLWLHGHHPATLVSVDAQVGYLPRAQLFMAQGWAFLADVRSYTYPPVSYLYPALWGAQAERIVFANQILSLLLVLLVFRTTSLWFAIPAPSTSGHAQPNTAAGLITALLFAISPTIHPYTGVVLTEPVFLFFAGVWVWALSEGMARRSFLWALPAGMAMGLAILTRASLLYFVYASAAMSLALLIFPRWRNKEMQMVALTQVFACVLPALVSWKNAYFFGNFAVAAGGGNALYYGLHPLTQGFEPAWVGVVYDDGSVTQTVSNLSPKGDIIMMGAAKQQIKEHLQHLPDAIAQAWGKLLAVFWFHPLDLEHHVWNMRVYRLLLWLFACIGWLRLRHPALKALLLGLIVYQLTIHSAVLYTQRYSVGALDLWLLLLAGAGVLALPAMRWPQRLLCLLGPLSLSTLSTLGWAHSFINIPPHPSLLRFWHQDLPQMQVQGWQRTTQGWRSLQTNPVVLIHTPKTAPFQPPHTPLEVNTTLSLSPDFAGPACRAMKVHFISDLGQVSSKPWVPLSHSSPTYQLGMSQPEVDWHTTGHEQGLYRIEFDCPSPTLLRHLTLEWFDWTYGQLIRQAWDQQQSKNSTP